MQTTKLSSNDSKVLQALFDPESALSSTVEIDAQDAEFPGFSAEDLARLKQEERAAIQTLNTPNPATEHLDAASKSLTDLITRHPEYSPAYANRAQILRLRAGDSLFSSDDAASVELIFNDLSKAISLASPIQPGAPVSSFRANLLATAHTHRGYLLMKAAHITSSSNESRLDSGPANLRGLSKDQLEEMASKDFFLGGKYGDKNAQQMAVKTNPYAKMCGAIVQEALKKEIVGQT